MTISNTSSHEAYTCVLFMGLGDRVEATAILIQPKGRSPSVPVLFGRIPYPEGSSSASGFLRTL